MTTERIDENVILELKDILEDEYEELVSTYIRDTKAKIAKLAQAVADADAANVRELAHSIKGASINLGVMQLGEMCNDLEAEAMKSQLSEFEGKLPPILEEAEWVCMHLIEL